MDHCIKAESHYLKEPKWDFHNLEAKIGDFQAGTIPDDKEWVDENDWFYKKYDVVVRITCLDGTFLVVVRKKI